ncbi:hypothetical protein GQ457_13G012480 [Hibiscus cannabinus]
MSRESRQRVWTLFVSNIADQLHWVWQVFDRHGVVVDVFISMRRSRRGQRFGFVRMATRAAALRVIERLHMRWIYGTRISVAFALRRGRDETWHLRKERQRGTIEVGGEERRHVLDSGESVTRKVRNGLHKSVTGVVAEDKPEVMDSCAVAWCKEGLRGRALVEELRRAEIRGCSVMRISGAMVLLMFVTTEERQALLDRYDLDQWFARIVAWSPEVRLDSRSVWVSVVGLPIHLWSHETFANLASLCGKLIRVECSTMEPQSFERARFFIESDKMDRIEEMVEVKTSEGLVVQVRVQESEKDDSVDVPNGVCEGPVTRENPLFWNGKADRGVANEDVGLVHREVSSSEQLRELGFMETQRALPPVPRLQDDAMRLACMRNDATRLTWMRNDATIPRVSRGFDLSGIYEPDVDEIMLGNIKGIISLGFEAHQQPICGWQPLTLREQAGQGRRGVGVGRAAALPPTPTPLLSRPACSHGVRGCLCPDGLMAHHQPIWVEAASDSAGASWPRQKRGWGRWAAALLKTTTRGWVVTNGNKIVSNQQVVAHQDNSAVEIVLSKGLSRKVRSVNDLVIDTLSAEQRNRLLKAQGKGKRGRTRKDGGRGVSFANESLTYSDFVARQTELLKEAEATVQLGQLVGVETLGREEELIKDITRIISTWGLGVAMKKRGVREFIRKQRCDMVFLLESKLGSVSERLVGRFWSARVFDFVAMLFGASGGDDNGKLAYSAMHTFIDRQKNHGMNFRVLAKALCVFGGYHINVGTVVCKLEGER